MAGAVGAVVGAHHSMQSKGSHMPSSPEGAQTWSQVFEEATEEEQKTFAHFLVKCTHSKIFETMLGLVIFLNMILVLMEADATVDTHKAPVWMEIANYIFLGVYTVELLIKLWAFGTKFFRSSWNIVDFLIVAVDWLLMIVGWIVGDLPSVSTLRIFRLARLARAFKFLNMFPELKLLMQGLLGAARAIFWGLVMIFLLMIIWGILAVQVIHPINMQVTHTEARTARAFSSVWQSILTFWQTIVSGDSWGEVALPIIHLQPWTLGFFGAVLVTVGLAMMNLILAVIVESATEARQQDQHMRAMEQEKMMQDAKHRLLQVCEMMDDDGSGTLSIEEFKKGYDENPEFADLLKIMNITKDDLAMVFKVCDEDNSGDVEYVEFVDNIHRMKSQESQLILFYVTEIRNAVNQVLQATAPSQKKPDKKPGNSNKQSDPRQSVMAGIAVDVDEGKETPTETKLRTHTTEDDLSVNVDKLMAICENLATKLERSSQTMELNSQALNSFKELPYLRPPNGTRDPSTMAVENTFAVENAFQRGDRASLHGAGASRPPTGPTAALAAAALGTGPGVGQGPLSVCCTSNTNPSDRERVAAIR